MNLISHLAANKNCESERDLNLEELKINSKELMESGYQLQLSFN